MSISIVTPSYNQAPFLGAAIASVLGQSYSSLEYVVMDGGSTDGSVEIIRRHAGQLAYWVSERDDGQYDAINKGFARTSGEIMAWLNSDDMYLPGALSVVADIFSAFPEVEWITSTRKVLWNEKGQAVACTPCSGFDRASFFRGANLPGWGTYGGSWIQQESTFWRRSLWERAGGRLDTSVRIAADFELWARFFQHADLYGVSAPLAGFRRHGAQKTAHHLKEYVAEAGEVLRRCGGRPHGRLGTLVRRLLAQAPGLRRCPRLLCRLGVLRPTRVISYAADGRWQIQTEYLF
ncbi:MAG: glycosyltransferase [Planctomycetes bacterium]|nr:glycosyltransferase [Planctomycetota bacterium]